MDLKDKKVTVIGLGLTGVSVANLLYGLGADVFISEIKPKSEVVAELACLNSGISYETGMHSLKILNSELIIKSPGVSNHLPVLAKVRGNNIPVWSELEFSFRLINPLKIIAITGTNGKTTTATLAGKIFTNAGYKTIVAGNIGQPLGSFVNSIDSNTVVVLEVSSYQLENIAEFRPNISCILNITPDHLEHHRTMKEYIMAKERIFENQTKSDYCVFNKNDKECVKLSKLCRSAKKVYFTSASKLKEGIYYCDRNFVINLPFANYTISPKLKIPGKHNIENVLSAIAIASISNIPLDMIENTINEFNGVEHRLEFIRKKEGVRYVNDSKSTNVNSTLVALESFESPIILIMGGCDKGSPYTPLRDLVKKKVKTLLLIGESADSIIRDLSNATDIINCGDVKTAVHKAKEISSTGDIVLLSPGCSSFDQFKNFEHRGKYYKELIYSL